MDITELKKSGEQRDNLLYDLNERIKELNCLYGVADIVEKHDASIDDMFQAIVDFLQLSWQYPDITCARISVDECEYKTKYFQETAWKQSSYIWVRDRHVGAVEVYYTKHRPEMDEGPFLKEERKLIDNIADRLGKIIERKQAEKALVKSEEQFRAIFYEAPYGIALVNSLTGDIYAVNKMFAQIAGRTITEMATIDWMSITHPDD
ncbi:MAG: histidine kinase, partial [bacterium]|nr:histidine kinase [bacterium]